MQNGMDKKAVIVAVVALLLLLAWLMVSLFLALGIEISVPSIFGTGAEADSTLEVELAPVPAEIEPVLVPEEIEAVGISFSQERLIRVEQDVIATAMRDDVLYFSLMLDDSPGDILIRELTLDEGTVSTALSVEWDRERVMDVFTFSVTEEGEFRILLIEYPQDDTGLRFLRFFYVKYTATGELLFQYELPQDLFQSLDHLSNLSAGFTAAGELVMHGRDGCDTRIAVVDANGAFQGEFDPGCGWIGKGRDGRIVFSDSHNGSLWELDLVSVSFGAQLAETGVTGVAAITVSPQGEFDLYFTQNVDGRSYAYGYVIETGEWTRLFDWDDIGYMNSRNFFLLATLPDGSIIVSQRFDDITQTDFILLTPEVY